MKEIELGYVDPTSGGKYGMADISRALSRNGYDDQTLADYTPEPSPVGGPNKPNPTSRKLNYGLSTPLPEGTIGSAETPGKYVPGAYPAPPIAVVSDNAGRQAPDAEETANDATLQALMGPTSGGQYANNGISGANSPLMQGVVS